MALKKLAAIAALAAVATPSLAFDISHTGSTTLFYVSIPIGAGMARKDRALIYGMQLQNGKRDAQFQAVNIDSRMLSLLPAGGLEAKWIIAGVVAAAAAVAVRGRDKGLQDQKAQHEQAVAEQEASCPKKVTNPC